MFIERRGVCGLVLMAALAAAQSAPEKKLKDGEYETYNEVIKDINTGSFVKAIADLDTWKQKFPQSDYADERAAYYVQAYAGGNQPAKSAAAATGLLARDLNTVFPAPGGQSTVIRVLYATCWAISHDPNPSAEELAAGQKAARQLMAYDQQMSGVTAEQWAAARADMKEKGAAALLAIAMLPGTQAMAKQPPDCTAAETAYTRALGDMPDKTVLSYELGRALNCLARENPDKLSAAIYEFQRAAVVDPKLGILSGDPKKVQTFADSAYVKLHGSDEGLAQLQQQVKQSPLPPAGFKIQSASEIAEEKRLEFEKSNPQLALWMKIKAALTAADGVKYFEGQLKESAVPELRGVVVEAKPACRPTELLVAVPLPEAQSAPRPEIRLKLEKALAGKPEAGSELRWEGVPTAFAPDPFLLTMDAETAKVQGLKLAACTAVPRKK